jgi:hypothetical protein
MFGYNRRFAKAMRRIVVRGKLIGAPGLLAREQAHPAQ